MSEMLERAAKAIRDDMGPVFGSPEYLAKPGNVERLEARQQRAAETHARLALLAALDPEDEALVSEVARGMHEADCALMNANPKNIPVDATVSVWVDENNRPLPPWAGHIDDAREAIVALKRLAQGERTVSEDQGRKD